MVDVTEDFLAKAKTYLGEEGKRVRNYFCCGLQDFSPEPSSYDVIWIQWVIGKGPVFLTHTHRAPCHSVLPQLYKPGSAPAVSWPAEMQLPPTSQDHEEMPEAS